MKYWILMKIIENYKRLKLLDSALSRQCCSKLEINGKKRNCKITNYTESHLHTYRKTKEQVNAPRNTMDIKFNKYYYKH